MANVSTFLDISSSYDKLGHDVRKGDTPSKGLRRGLLNYLVNMLQDEENLIDCQGAHEEPKGRPKGPRDLKTAGGIPLALLPLPGPPGLPSGFSWTPWRLSSYPYLEACYKAS